VGFTEGRHTLIPDGVVVYENDRITYVGRRFDGHAEAEIDARGKLVCPGFIDTHVHSGHRASHRLITDTGRPDFFGQPFLEVSVPREGTRVGGDPRYARPTDVGAEADNCLLATFTIAEMLRNGITTFMEFGSQLRVQEALLGEVGRLRLGPLGRRREGTSQARRGRGGGREGVRERDGVHRPRRRQRERARAWTARSPRSRDVQPRSSARHAPSRR
jgi:cytosine/adenosine deaminase-related metal-dependent hydrolase